MRSSFKLLLNLKNDPALLAIILFTLALVTFFILIPLYNILLESLTNQKMISLQNYKDVFAMHGNVQILTNTILLGIVTATISVAIGFVFAYVTTYMKIRFRRTFDFIAILPIISPPFVVALSAILLFGRVGLITRGLLGLKDAEIYGFHGLVLVQSLSFFPIAYMMLVALLQRIDPSVEEASRDLGASRFKVFTSVTLPLMAPGLANAFLLVFIQSIADFANPVVIGGNFTTVAVKIYQEGIGNYQFGTATALAMVLLSISISIFVLQKYYVSKKSYVTVTGKVSRHRDLISSRKITVPATTVLTLFTVFVIMMYILIPIGSFVKLWGVNYTPTLEHYRYIFKPKLFQPVVTTTILAAVATPVSGILGMIIAFLIVRKKFFGKSFIEFTTIMALAIPGTIIGLGYVISYNKSYGIAGLTLIPPITGTAFIIIMAFIIRSLPVGVRSGITSLQQIDPTIEEAASVLGASSSKVFSSVTIPMIKNAFLNGLIFTFARSMTLVSTVIFLISAQYKLLTTSIMAQIDVGRMGVASAYCTILIIIVSLVMLLIKFLIRNISTE
ncbi:iron ABC transporter permease [Oceanispirochaeta crateris]|uniref:Iron ABC transporter permease n=2 Tax=Oceanispirochaeta crateris TaxID=2518645 RepID=A0A5C1QQE0_9SPIO|nr:iron ABC transporter permease [Oceanispirochaeta crateris]